MLIPVTLPDTDDRYHLIDSRRAAPSIESVIQQFRGQLTALLG